MLSNSIIPAICKTAIVGRYVKANMVGWLGYTECHPPLLANQCPAIGYIFKTTTQETTLDVTCGDPGV
jgi:hypothetical protein